MVYKTERIIIPVKAFKETVSEAVVADLDKTINERAADGWKLIAHSCVASVEVGGCYLLVTFGKE